MKQGSRVVRIRDYNLYDYFSYKHKIAKQNKLLLITDRESIISSWTVQRVS